MAIVYTPPSVIPEHDRINYTVFLAGSIESDTAQHWQKELCVELGNIPDLTILNPRRVQWDKSWANTMDNPVFKEQVDWELDGIELADTVIFYFDPNTISPITLLELGIMSQMIRLEKKVIVCCPYGYFRKGNVDILVERMKKSIMENKFYPPNADIDDYVMVVNTLSELKVRTIEFLNKRLRTTYRDIKEALLLGSLFELNKEIEIRKGLLEQMVGSLYPSIIENELIQLQKRYEDVFYLVKNNVEYLTENKNGTHNSNASS